jgi:gliding motility-associated-like protein
LNYSGTDVFTYSICDNGTPVLCDQATVTISVTAVNDVPIATDDANITNMDTPVVINVVSNDTDIDGTINPSSVSIVSGPTHGTISIDPVTGKITYTPNSNYSGTDVFTYSVCDNGTPVLCDQATVSITVGDCLTNPLLDCDGDGVTNSKELTDGTDPNNPCEVNLSSQSLTPSNEWKLLDCDTDGITNGDEISQGSKPFDHCSPNSCDINVMEAFTPDGDGINETFVIEGLSKYPENEITILNRWGNKVYHAVNYQNDWDGISQNDLNIDGDALPTGTYYYVLDTKDSQIGVVKGYIYLQR